MAADSNSKIVAYTLRAPQDLIDSVYKIAEVEHRTANLQFAFLIETSLEILKQEINEDLDDSERYFSSRSRGQELLRLYPELFKTEE